MTKIQIDDLFRAISGGITVLAETTVKNYLKEAKKDGERIVKSVKENVINWAQLLLEGKLSTEDFEWLMLRQKDLVAMDALKQAGLAQIRIEAFKQSVLSIIIDSVFTAVKI